MSYWIIVGSPGNFAKTKELGFKVQGMKSRHRRKAEKMAKGDKLIWYITGSQAFAGYASITGEYFEDHSRLWGSSKKPDEDYPWRVPIKKEVVLPETRWVATEPLARKMKYVSKWPAPHWRLAFQGNVHEIPKGDFELISKELEKSANRKAG